MTARNCDVCGRAFDAKRPQAKFCGGTCRKRSSRGAGPPPPPYVPTVAVEESGSLAAAVLTELTAANKHNTARGVQAVCLAARMDKFDTGGGLAALSKELDRLMAELVRGAVSVGDPVDELRARRDAKRAG